MFSWKYGFVLLAMACAAARADAQLGGQVGGQTAPLPAAPSAVVRPLVLTGGVEVAREQPDTVRLTVDEAIATALKSNTQIYLRGENEKNVRGQILTVGNELLPNLAFKAYSQTQEINLAGMGFKPATLSSIMIPGFNTSGFKTVVKVNTTDAEVTLSQALFNAPAYFLYRASQKAAEAANWETLSTRGSIVLETGGLYLRALADQAQADNAAALVKQDEVVFEHARAERDAGVGINLDVLRAQVQLQNEQQELIRDVNAVAKDKVQLNRAMGQPAGQALELVDTVPFAELDDVSVGQAMQIAEVKRKDLRGLEAQLEVAHKTAQAVKYQRLPTLGVGGFYGVLGETTGLYHGVFAAEGRLSIPVFEEATLRGEKEVAQSQIMGLEHQIDARRGDIESEIRTSLLDVETNAELVRVARSNVELARQALSDSVDRFNAGVDDSLPVVRAQASLVGAETQVVQAEFQYNYAKLELARYTGVVESEYRRYLGR